jgi:hypothetical protein
MIKQAKLNLHYLQKHPFTIEAALVLPDHLHMIWRLPENDGDYATRWRLIKRMWNDGWVSLRSTQQTPAMPDRIPLSRVRERGRGEGEQRYTSGTTPTDFRLVGDNFIAITADAIGNKGRWAG